MSRVLRRRRRIDPADRPDEFDLSDPGADEFPDDGFERDAGPVRSDRGTAAIEPVVRLRLRRRLALRTRLALLFPAATMVLTSLLAAGTLLAVRATEQSDRESNAKRLAYANATTLLNRVRPASEPDSIDRAVVKLRPASGEVTLGVNGAWYATDPSLFGENDIPERLRTTVVDGRRAAIQRVRIDRQTVLIVGVPIEPLRASYFQLTPLTDLDRTLESLSVALPGAVAITTILAALLGRWFARAALAPLVDVRRAAEKVAAQQLDTRLPETSDAELSPIVESFNKMVAALQERVVRDARFTSDVSHELRSPLTTLSASVEVLLRRRDELGERASSAIDLLADEVERFQSLVSDLLEISRFDAGAQHLELTELMAVEFLAGVSRQAAGRSVPIRHLPGEERLLITADRRRLVQVLTNLISNAEKYGEGVTQVTLDVVEGGVEIGVEDAGGGVPEAERELIFERFARGVTAGQRGDGQGTGLGLALTLEHVQLHGGRIWCTTARSNDTGARFAFFLPTELDRDFDPEAEEFGDVGPQAIPEAAL